MNPDQYTNKEFYLDVGDGHQLYVQDWGNPKGLPIIFLHGGPGGSVGDKDKRKFDPRLHHVIFFDQRGCGKSLPYASRENNTTQHLVEDIRIIADHAHYKKFVLIGGSWGSCLALAYAVKYPSRVASLVLDGIMTGNQREIDYVDKGGFIDHFPDAWERYLLTVPEEHRHNPTEYHFERALGKDEQAARMSAAAYQNLILSIFAFDDRFAPVSADDPTYDPSPMIMEMYYMKHRCFMPDNYVLDNAHKLTMPVWMVQGRYDMVCPPIGAYELNKRLPNGHLILTASNHWRERESATTLRAILTQMTEKG